MSTHLSYKKAIAKELLNDVDLKRLAIITLLHAGNIKPAVNLAAYESDTTQGSFPVVLRNTLSKLRKNECIYSDDELGTAAGAFSGALSYKKAIDKGLLKDIDFKRLAIIYLLHNEEMKLPKQMVELAAGEAGLTAGSWPVVLRNTTNKIRKAGCEYTEEEELRYSANIAATPRAPKTPGSGKSTGGRRKAKEVESDNDEIVTPSKKPRQRATKAKPKVKDEEDDAMESGTLDEEDNKVVSGLKDEVDQMDEPNYMKEFLVNEDDEI